MGGAHSSQMSATPASSNTTMPAIPRTKNLRSVIYPLYTLEPSSGYTKTTMQHPRTAIWRIRELRGSSLVELMLVCAVITILATRAYLALTGYPQVGGATLHIAHMLWGGLLMLISALVLFQAADRVWKPTIAIIFGIGFGLFIDEVGKFVTRDNDYFFQPAVAIMYVIFVIILLSTHFIARIDKKAPEEYLYFATETLARSWVGPISDAERTQALRYISLSGNTSPEADTMRTILEHINVADKRAYPLWHTWDALWNRCHEFLASSRFQKFIVIVAFAYAIIYAAGMLVRNHSPIDTFGEWLNLAWQVAVAVFLIVGIAAWFRNKRLTAFRLFYFAMLIMLLIGQIFTFVSQEFYGLISLTINVATLLGLRGTIESQSRTKPTEDITT